MRRGIRTRAAAGAWARGPRDSHTKKRTKSQRGWRTRMAIAAGRNGICPCAKNSGLENVRYHPEGYYHAPVEATFSWVRKGKGRQTGSFNNFRSHIGDVSTECPIRLTPQRKSGAC